MRKIEINLDELSTEVLKEMAVSTDNYDLLLGIYDIALEKDDDILIHAILKNKNREVKEIVEDIARNSRFEYNFTDFDKAIQNRESNAKENETFKEVKYNQSELLAESPYTPVDVLIDLLYSGEISVLFNVNLPGNVIETFLTHPETYDWVSNNPIFIQNLLKKVGYKLTNLTLKFIQSVDFENDEENVTNALAWQALERRKERRTLKKNI